MRLKLIVPHAPGGGGGLTPNLGIITLAALTPNRFEVSIVDENVEELNFDEEVALVGITVMTATSPRS
ncbi:MAG: radical SAM protein, partial [Candidatus Bathyarchaeota archaeon]|nr:radical SAM protein [Candidatus Bathyarchaeota archaeon]